MRFRSIDELLCKSPDEIYEFLKDCTVVEKMNTHYIKINIISPNNVVCCKFTGEPVTQTDIILNGMWRHFMEDWSYIRNNPGFKQFAKQYKGCIIGMYYIPCHNPLGTEYDFPASRCYIINQCYDTYNRSEMSTFMAYRCLKQHMGVTTTDIDKRYIIKENKTFELSLPKLESFIQENRQFSVSDILDLIKFNESDIIAKNKDPESLSLILRNGKTAYEITGKESTDSCHITDVKERSSYEFVLCDFIRFFNERNMISRLRGSYRNIVCYLFNEYIMSWEKQSGYIKHNVVPESICPPHVGYDHGDSIIPTYVPNMLTLDLCNEDVMYRNIFKLLLANLKIMKYPKYCVYLNKEQIGALNTIVQAISIISTDTTPFQKRKKKS